MLQRIGVLPCRTSASTHGWVCGWVGRALTLSSFFLLALYAIVSKCSARLEAALFVLTAGAAGGGWSNTSISWTQPVGRAKWEGEGEDG